MLRRCGAFLVVCVANAPVRVSLAMALPLAFSSCPCPLLCVLFEVQGGMEDGTATGFTEMDSNGVRVEFVHGRICISRSTLSGVSFRFFHGADFET